MSPPPAPLASPADPPPLTEEEARRIDLTWSAGVVGALMLVFALLSLFSGVAVPLLIALALAYALNLPVTYLWRRGLTRMVATSVVLAAITLLLGAAVLYLVPALSHQAERLPDFFRRASSELVPRVEQLLGISLPELLRQRSAELGAQASEVVRSTGPAVAKALAHFAGNTARWLGAVLGLLVVPVLCFFFLKDYPALVAAAQRLVPRRAVGLVSQRFAEVDQVLSSFVQGQLTVGAILSVIYSAGLAAARVELAIVIGLIAGFGNMVPYLGTALGVVLAMFGVLLSWHGAWQLAVVAATFVIAQAAEGLVITPRIVGDKVGLSPVAVILAILAFGELFGFVGIVLAVPSTAVLKVVTRVALERYVRTPLYLGEVPPK